MRNAPKNTRSRRAQDIESRAGRSKRAKSLSKSRDFKSLRPAAKTAATGLREPAKVVETGTREVAPIGPHPTDPNRNALGHYIAENDGRLTHGGYRKHRARALEPLRRGWEREILLDKGFTETEQPPRVFGLTVEALADVAVMMVGVSTHITELGGPLTGKGYTKRAMDAYFKLLDRFVRLASLVGLDRTARTINESPEQWLMRTAAEREQQQQAHDHSAEADGSVSDGQIDDQQASVEHDS